MWICAINDGQSKRIDLYLLLNLSQNPYIISLKVYEFVIRMLYGGA